MAKSLLLANAGGVYQVAEGSLLALTRPLIEFLRDFRAGTTSVPRGAPRMLNKRSTTDYSRISYDALRKIADNDAISDHISDEECESLPLNYRESLVRRRATTQHNSAGNARGVRSYTALPDRVGPAACW